ncbi:uncharacterized protein SPPG_00038 [Spizellomyces punctatus DAOM BR117]|uniref:Uncharacterized protein n=1 Tax=Spizellomyces punctatus (strain DAOM BR117) TaxID=645134 RepID=A0A0L0HTS7_SPIPD|nr:uncharacterized protein SPPG_00038 [Spizellomyces punctatus DAOM BR117]KND04305.1 hypothetical protein SPPG_00038 [Spizellomyces punctatus DAOM BR117]|eukprot:XP_016612344.1 hypothetical protein SPPG_00038 [Spizellomyces punctatus DAOM BR117]
MATDSSWPCDLSGIYDLNGYTIDHWTLQTNLCVSNKLVLAFSIPNTVFSCFVCGLMVVFMIRDFQIVGRQWTLSKAFYLATSITCMGLMIGSLEVFAKGRAVSVLNSLVWIFGSEGLMVAAFCTLFHWVKFTIQMVDMHEQEILRQEMIRLRKTLLVPTHTVFIICLPILFVRAAYYSLENQKIYNIASLLYFGSMIPWFINWAVCSYKFSIHFSAIIVEAVKSTSQFNMEIKQTQNPQQDASALTPQTQTTLAGTATSHKMSNPARLRGQEMLKIAQRVRWVGIGIVMDKVLFTAAYLSVMISSSISWKSPPKNTAPYGFYAFYLMVLPGANFLILAMSYYHYRTKPAKSASSSASNA